MTLAALALFSVSAQATLVFSLATPQPGEIGCQNTLGLPNLNCWTAGTGAIGINSRHIVVADNGNSTILDAYSNGGNNGAGKTIDPVPGFAGLDLLYKANSNDDPFSTDPALPEFGDLKDSYSTKFVIDLMNPSVDGFTGATISHDDGEPKADCKSPGSLCYLLVKDGNNNPTSYLFDISMIWDGEMDIVLKNFWGTDGAGSANGSISNVQIWGPSPVPVPAAVWLFGTALLGFIGLSRSARV